MATEVDAAMSDAYAKSNPWLWILLATAISTGVMNWHNHAATLMRFVITEKAVIDRLDVAEKNSRMRLELLIFQLNGIRRIDALIEERADSMVGMISDLRGRVDRIEEWADKHGKRGGNGNMSGVKHKGISI